MKRTAKRKPVAAGEGAMPRKHSALDSPQRQIACPSLLLWREFKAAEKALNDVRGDERSSAYLELETAFHEASERFIYATDATLLGVLLKLEKLNELENLAAHLRECPNAQWPRIVLTVLHDLRGAVATPTLD
jgi:hypothetical protein